MNNFNEEVCTFVENSQIENFETNTNCNKNPQAILDNQTCNYWSNQDEQTQQTINMSNWRTTGTVLPGHDCWYEKTQQCVSEKCLESEDPTKDCPKRNNWNKKVNECIIC